MIRQYVEKPGKILAEQYLAATSPPIAGVCVLAHDVVPDGRPHVHLPGFGPKVLTDTDVLVWSYYTADLLIAVMPAAEFEDRYGTITEDAS